MRGSHHDKHSLGKDMEAGRTDGALGGQRPALGVSVLLRQARHAVKARSLGGVLRPGQGGNPRPLDPWLRQGYQLKEGQV